MNEEFDPSADSTQHADTVNEPEFDPSDISEHEIIEGEGFALFDESVSDEERLRVMRSSLEGFELEEDDMPLLNEAGEFIGFTEPAPVALQVLSIVCRPNVGKSALVNRILGRREAVVEDVPGVTRDRVTYQSEWGNTKFSLVDTGGWEPDARGIDASVAQQAEIAVELCDVVLFVVDSRVGATATDERVVQMLRRSHKPVFLVANKVDDAVQEPEVAALWSLGLGEPWPVSALHGRGVADLLDAVMKVMPEQSAVAKPQLGGPRRVAILGRPNVGKSSLLNKAAGEERVVVNDSRQSLDIRRYRRHSPQGSFAAGSRLLRIPSNGCSPRKS